MRPARSLTLLAVLAAAGGSVAAFGAPALLFLPVLLLFALLLRGRYVGEDRIVRLARAARRARRPRAPRALRARTRRSRPAAPRGGLLIALALAVRPPPARAVPRAV
jgi:hypothetical protein